MSKCEECGADLKWEECEVCDGEGVDGHECGEDCCNCLHPVDNLPCQFCDGQGGWEMCPNFDDAETHAPERP